MNVNYSTIKKEHPLKFPMKGLKDVLKKICNKYEGVLSLVLDETLEQDIHLTVGKTWEVKASSQELLFKGSIYLARWMFLHPEFTGKKTIVAPTQKNLLMVDMGRKFYPLEALKQLVDQMALFQYDFLQLHFSENQGFRIESEKYPEITSEKHLTKNEVRELILYANARFIEIIPDFDSPGHLAHILKNHPTWRLPMYDENKNLTSSESALDILNSEAVSYIHSIYQEFAELFPNSRYFHIGADEFVPFDELENYPTLLEEAKRRYGKDSSGIELFIEYVNKTAAYVSELGFWPLVWNDGFYRKNRTEQLHLTKDCTISYWTRWNENMATPETFLEKGYELVNHNDNYFYYVLGEHASYTYPTYEKITKDWTPTHFPQKQEVATKDLSQVFGNAVAIWSDIPDAKTAEEVNQDIFYILAALMEQTWLVPNEGKQKLEALQKQFK